MKKLRIGFIGLGLMGKPMAKNILKAGFNLSVYNRTLSKTDEFKKLDASVYNSPSELAKNTDVIISMITAPKDVKAVMLEKNGVVDGAREGLIIMDMSTIGPQAAKEICYELKKKNVHFLDAPVTGSVVKAESGELTIFIGGEKAIFEKVKPVLLAMGKNLQYIGKSGSGQAVKLINNLIVATSVASLAQGMVLADALGLSRKKVADALFNVPALSPMMQMKIPNMIKSEYPTAFSAANMYKDLKLALGEGQKRKRNTPILKLIESLYEKTVFAGLGEKDMSAILETLTNQ